jgi:hypothetical protein
MIWFRRHLPVRARIGGGVILTTVLKLQPMAAIILLGLRVLLTEPSAYTRDPPTSTWTLKDLMAAPTTALYRCSASNRPKAGGSCEGPGADDPARHAQALS